MSFADAFVPLIETRRGDAPELMHVGAVAVVDTRGRVLANAGDPQVMAFTRSTLKFIQALPFVAAGGLARFGFDARQTALLCASHNGEPMHVDTVQGMLDAAGVTHRQLKCGCHVPYFVDLGVAPTPASYDERHHNCSGKHAGFLAWCVQQGASLESYLEPSHPLQQAIRTRAMDVAGVDESRLAMGIDGCSAPNFALPLAALARAYARLASGANDPVYGEAFAALSGAMVAHPELVSGTGRNDLAFTRAGRGDWVSKVGADGVQCVASKSRGQALALKVAGGDKLAAVAATVEALDQLGWLDDAQRTELAPWRSEAILSVKGAVVGERRAVFRLADGV